MRADPHAAADLALLSTCINNATTWETARACANITYKLCLDRIEGHVAHVTQADCNIRERDLWLHLFSLKAMKIEAWTLLKDRQMRAAGDNRVHGHDAFLRFQSAFEQYRQWHCRIETASIGAGNAKMTNEPICQMRVIAEGIVKLRALQVDMTMDIAP